MTDRIHIDYLLLTRQGVIVLDVRDVAGHVFGSEPMQEWTVLGRKRRFTFANPLPQLYDRMAAVTPPGTRRARARAGGVHLARRIQQGLSAQRS